MAILFTGTTARPGVVGCGAGEHPADSRTQDYAQLRLLSGWGVGVEYDCDRDPSWEGALFLRLESFRESRLDDVKFIGLLVFVVQEEPNAFAAMSLATSSWLTGRPGSDGYKRSGTAATLCWLSARPV